MRDDDLVFTQSNVGLFGWPAGATKPDDVLPIVLHAYESVLTRGTLCVPTYSYSFAVGEPYDVQLSPSVAGVLPEYLRQRREARRSSDPMLSIAALGQQAAEVVSGLSEECLGPGSFWQRLVEADGFVCNLNFHAPSTLVHYAERILRVPYRYDKLFLGTILEAGRARPGRAIHFVADPSNPLTQSHYRAIAQMVKGWPFIRTARVGRGFLVGYRARPFLRGTLDALRHHPWILTRAGDEGIAPKRFVVPTAWRRPRLVFDAPGMLERVGVLARAPRSLVGDGRDEILSLLAKELPLVQRRFETGTKAAEWFVPERWQCESATVRAEDGREIFSLSDHPFRVPEYSLSVDRVVSRQELIARLHAHPGDPDALPNISRPFELQWGFASSSRELDRLDAKSYSVHISAAFSRGMMSIGEVLVPGREEREIHIASHTWSGTANDGASGVAVAVAVARQLLERSPLRFSYRFVFAPGELGRIVHVTAGDRKGRDVGGVILDRLGCPGPFEVLRIAGDGVRSSRAFGEHSRPASEHEAAHFAWPVIHGPVVAIVRGGAHHSGSHRDTVARCERSALEESVIFVRDALLRLDAAL